MPRSRDNSYTYGMATLRLERMLKKKHMTKYGFAKALGIDTRNVWRYFRDDFNPRLNTLNDMARALKCKVKDLLSE